MNLYPNVKAADVPDVDLSELPQIDYSWGLEWEDPKIEMLFIVPPNKPDWVRAVEPLVKWKNEKGVKTIILNDTSFTSAENIRNMIKSYYERENIRWVLLCGDAQSDLIPIREAHIETIGGGATDYYYADLTGNWDTDEIEWTPDVYVGRLPANDVNELELMVNKILKYETDPLIGQWMNRMLLAGGISEPSDESPYGYEDEGRLTQYIWQNYIPSDMNFSHLVDYTGYPGYYWDSQFIPDDPFVYLTQAKVRQNMTAGYSTILMAGHGANTMVQSRQKPTPTDMYTTSDARSCGNTNMPSLIYLDACATTQYHNNDNNLGETLINQTQAGAIGVIGALENTYYYSNDGNLEKLNRGNAKLFWREFFVEKKFQQGRALYDSKLAYINSDYYQNRVHPDLLKYERRNLLTYNLLGDPEVDIYTDIPFKTSNPFSGSLYEGQLVTNTVRDINGKAVPYARVFLQSNNTKYNHTTYANKYGQLNFRMYPRENTLFNVTVTGHNLIPSHFNFTTLSDTLKPIVDDEDCDPEDPTVSDKICVKVNSYDLHSGIESVFLLQSEDEDDFDDDYIYYNMYNSFKDEKVNKYEYTVPKLESGEYFFLVVARDWMNNYYIYDDKSFEVDIPIPMIDYLLMTIPFIAAGVVGISVIVLYKGYRDFKQINWKLQRESPK